jgi:hypothetical protein
MKFLAGGLDSRKHFINTISVLPATPKSPKVSSATKQDKQPALIPPCAKHGPSGAVQTIKTKKIRLDHSG